eukprot:1137234-Pelagomonas_calceolata.AAC.3
MRADATLQPSGSRALFAQSRNLIKNRHYHLHICWETYLAAAFLRVKDPFDNLPFLLYVAQTFGRQVNLQAMQVIDMLVLTFKALAFTALMVSSSGANCHVFICVWDCVTG